MEKPHLSKFVFESFDPVHEAGKQARWFGVLAEFQKGSDGVYRKVLSAELTLAQLEDACAAATTNLPLMFTRTTLAAMRRAETAEAQITALQNEVTQARADRDAAQLATRDADRKYTLMLQEREQFGRELVSAKTDLHDALAARDNFAALEKKARGELIAFGQGYADACEQVAENTAKLTKIPGFIRKTFGAA